MTSFTSFIIPKNRLKICRFVSWGDHGLIYIQTEGFIVSNPIILLFVIPFKIYSECTFSASVWKKERKKYTMYKSIRM